MYRSLLVLPLVLGLTFAQDYGQSVGSLSQNAHGVSGDVYIVDNTRIRIRNFNYDGTGPDAFFWVGTTDQPGMMGTIVPDETGSTGIIKGYTNADIVLTLPSGLTVSTIKWLSVWCRQARSNFGHVTFPGSMGCMPASRDIGALSSLTHGVSSGTVTVIDTRTVRIVGFNYDGAAPDAFFIAGTGEIKISNGQKISERIVGRKTDETVVLVLPDALSVNSIEWISAYCISFTENFGDIKIPNDLCVPPYIPPAVNNKNCAQMNPDFNVMWEIKGSEIEFEYQGALDGRDGYMAFGISGSTTKTAMIDADPMVVYLDNGTPKVADYTISAYSLCSGSTGVCPDTSASGTESLQLISHQDRDGVTSVKFKRPLATGDAKDKDISSSGSMYVVWAMGNVNGQSQVTRHTKYAQADKQIDFGRAVSSDCQPIVPKDKPEVTAWPAPQIQCGSTNTFRATLGLAGGDKGYKGITKQISWGIAWYLNGVLIPEITVLRGQTYTFHVEGGSDPSNQARYHPLYITDDSVGGYAEKSAAEKLAVKIYAGVDMMVNSPEKATVGRYCEYTSTSDPLDFDNFGDYQKTLKKECDDGEEGKFTWTPDNNTPDLVYYQCFTHNFLGWKIHVVGDCSERSSSTINHSPDGLLGLTVLISLVSALTSWA